MKDSQKDTTDVREKKMTTKNNENTETKTATKLANSEQNTKNKVAVYDITDSSDENSDGEHDFEYETECVPNSDSESSFFGDSEMDDIEERQRMPKSSKKAEKQPVSKKIPPSKINAKSPSRQSSPTIDEIAENTKRKAAQQSQTQQNKTTKKAPAPSSGKSKTPAQKKKAPPQRVPRKKQVTATKKRKTPDSDAEDSDAEDKQNQVRESKPAPAKKAKPSPAVIKNGTATPPNGRTVATSVASTKKQDDQLSLALASLRPKTPSALEVLSEIEKRELEDMKQRHRHSLYVYTSSRIVALESMKKMFQELLTSVGETMNNGELNALADAILEKCEKLLGYGTKSRDVLAKMSEDKGDTAAPDDVELDVITEMIFGDKAIARAKAKEVVTDYHTLGEAAFRVLYINKLKRDIEERARYIEDRLKASRVVIKELEGLIK